MSQSQPSTPESDALPPSQTVTRHTPEPLIATSLVRGFAACETPLHDPKDAPVRFRKSARWTVWTRVPRTTYGRMRKTQRALLKPSGAISHNAAPSIWQSLEGATELAKQLGVKPQEGGLAYILPPITDTAPPSALFFTLPPFTTISPGPLASALKGLITPLPGPFTAAGLESLAAKPHEPVFPPQGTGESPPPPQGTGEPAPPPEVTSSPNTVPLWLPADAIPGGAPVWPPDAALLDTLKQSRGWIYGYVPLVGKWCWLRVALEPDTSERADPDPEEAP